MFISGGRPRTDRVVDGDGYTAQDALVGVPFDVDIAAAPVTTSSATVTNSTELAAALTSGTEITIDGSVGDLDMNNVNNVDVILTSNADVRFVDIDYQCHHIRLRGENPRDGEVKYIFVGNVSDPNAPSDIIFDGITQKHLNYEGGDYPRASNDFVANRLVIINCDFEAREFCFRSFSSADSRLEHAIVGNNRMLDKGTSLPFSGQSTNGEACVRMQGVSRTVWADNQIQTYLPDDYQVFRVHAQPTLDAEYVYVARNQFESGWTWYSRSGDSNDTQEIRHVYHIDNEHYAEGSVGLPVKLYYGNGSNDVNGDRNHPVEFTATGNQIYNDYGAANPPANAIPTSPPFNPNGSEVWSVSNPAVVAFQTPPTWSFSTGS